MKRQIIGIIIAFPCLAFGSPQKSSNLYNYHANKHVAAELYLSNNLINNILDSKNHFVHQYQPKDSLHTVFEEKKSNKEIHFVPLNFTQEIIEDFSMEWLPVYDFSKESNIEDYEKFYKMPQASVIRLLKIRFPFF